MYIKTSKKWQNVLDFSMIILGTLIMGFSFRTIIKDIDPTAFVYATKVSEVMGEWASSTDVSKTSK